MAVFSSFYSTLNGYNSLDIQDNDIKVYIFEISVKFRIDWYITCIGLKKVKIWLNTWGGNFRILTGFIFANDDQFAKINPRENLYSRKLILAKIYTFKVISQKKLFHQLLKYGQDGGFFFNHEKSVITTDDSISY